jgi:hypothetical protein
MSLHLSTRYLTEIQTLTLQPGWKIGSWSLQCRKKLQVGLRITGSHPKCAGVYWLRKKEDPQTIVIISSTLPRSQMPSNKLTGTRVDRSRRFCEFKIIPPLYPSVFRVSTNAKHSRKSCRAFILLLQHHQLPHSLFSDSPLL